MRSLGGWIALLVSFSVACRTPERAMSSDASASDAASDAMPDVTSDASPDASPEPASSVRLAEPPDVRVVVPPTGQAKGTVKVGQIFGILVPVEADFLDEWELQAGCPLGDPLTFITRENGRELLWKIDADKIGTHAVFVVLMHRETRTSLAKPKKRAKVTVEVVP